MNKEFCTYEQALALKELGFREPVFAGYDMETNELYVGRGNDGPLFNYEYYEPAPLKQQVFTWCRDKHNLISWVYISHNEFFYTIVENGRYVKGVGSHANYDEAEDGCINKLIEILKK
jgi:hypothetical protein